MELGALVETVAWETDASTYVAIETCYLGLLTASHAKDRAPVSLTGVHAAKVIQKRYPLAHCKRSKEKERCGRSSLPFMFLAISHITFKSVLQEKHSHLQAGV